MNHSQLGLSSNKNEPKVKRKKCIEGTKRTFAENEYWYAIIFLMMFFSFSISIFLIYEINYGSLTSINPDRKEFFNVVLFATLGGTTATRLHFKQTYNLQLCPHVLDVLGYVSRIFCAISVALVVYFGLEVFASSLITVEVSNNNSSNIITFISFIVGYYSEHTIKQLESFIKKEQDSKEEN